MNRGRGEGETLGRRLIWDLPWIPTATSRKVSVHRDSQTSGTKNFHLTLPALASFMKTALKGR